jgi:hypothetical protein
MDFRFEYGSKRLTAEQLERQPKWNRLHPEFRRRLMAMFIAAKAAGVDLGIGSGWRSSERQRQVFLSRYVPSPTGTINWDGKKWAKKKGVAAAAPPGLSYHEETDKDGFAFAADIVGDIKWMNANCERFGLIHFANVNREPWHVQPAELPRSRAQYRGQKLGLSAPPTVQPPPLVKPTSLAYPGSPVRLGSKGEAVKHVQRVVNASPIDGSFGGVTDRAVKAWQTKNGLLADGIVGPVTWRKMFNG